MSSGKEAHMSARKAAVIWMVIFHLGAGGILMAGASEVPAEGEITPPSSGARPAEPGGLVQRAGEDTQTVLDDELLAGLSVEERDLARAGRGLVEVPPVAAAESLIHPDLEPLLDSSDLVDVFLLLRSEPTPGMPDPWAIKQQHMPAIKNLGKTIRDLGRSKGMQGSAEMSGASRQEEDRRAAQAGEQQFRELHEEADRRLDLMRREVAMAHAGRAAQAQNIITGQVTRHGGRVLSRMATGNVLRVALPGSAIPELAAHPLVGQIVPVREGAPSLNVSQGVIKAWAYYNGGFTGGIYDAGVADTGVQENHPAFAGINFFNNTGSPTDPDVNGHGTHVAGIIASRDSTNQGIAWGLDSLIWGPAGGNAFLTMDWAVTTATQGPEVFNMSWSYGIANDVDYNYEDRWFDVYIDYYSVPVVFSAGNSSWNDTQPTLRHPSAGYNSITVANMNDQNTAARSDDVRSSDSSVGPTLSGRRKPDISAPGSSIAATNAGWTGNGATGGPCGVANINDYCVQGGTSMASPHVAGAVLLMTETGIFDVKIQKALLINSADWWTSNNTQTPADDGMVTVPTSSASMWDKSYGWGYMDLNRARINENDYFLDSVVPYNGTPTEDDFKLYKGTHVAGDRATLVYKRRGTRGSNWPTDKFDSSVFNLSDLNLILYSQTSGAVLDVDYASIDNVRQVHSVAAGDVVVKVDAWSTSFDGATAEEFALATRSDFVAVDFPDQFQGFASWPAEVEPNELFDVTFWLANNSDLASFQNDMDLNLPPGFVRWNGAEVQSDPVIEAGGSSTAVTWTIRAPSTDVGASNITVGHSHTSYQESWGVFSWNLGLTVRWDTLAPAPNPMTWQLPPDDSSTTSLYMLATAATDPHGARYFFDFTSSPTGGGGAGDAWRPSPDYSDTSLGINHEYCYRVLAEDYAFVPNFTGYSPTECAFTGIEPSTGPEFTAIVANTMHVRSLNVPSGLTRGLSGLKIFNTITGTETSWHQNNNSYIFSGLTPNTSYSFWVQARNGDGGISLPSPAIARYTKSAVPISLGVAPFSNDTTLAASVDPADANPDGTEYLFENTTLGTNSGWTTATEWANSGLTCGSSYTYYARSRNAEGVESGSTYLGFAVAGFDTDMDGQLNCVDVDDDGDGILDVSDCNPLDASVWLRPSEIDDLELDHSGVSGGITSLAWTSPANSGTSGTVHYDLISTKISDTWSDPGASCEEGDEVDLVASHAVDPPVGDIVFFLGRPENTCGNGPAGNQLLAGVPAARTRVRDCGCKHNRCQEGVALDPTCNTCVTDICAVDPYCCTTAWDSFCVSEVASVCGETCP